MPGGLSQFLTGKVCSREKLGVVGRTPSMQSPLLPRWSHKLHGSLEHAQEALLKKAEERQHTYVPAEPSARLPQPKLSPCPSSRSSNTVNDFSRSVTPVDDVCIPHIS